MTERLQIAALRAGRFGRWTNFNIDLPPDPFLVVHGENESGKSTLAEMIVWLLVGTADLKGINAVVYGEPGESLACSMVGSLGATPFETNGSFKINTKGAPKSDVQVNAGVNLDLDGWRSRLGGVDDAVFRSIYRLSGVDLHSSGGASRQLVRLSLGELGSSSEPGEAIARLREVARICASGRAQGVESVATTRRLIEGLGVELRLAQSNSDNHHRVEGLINEATTRGGQIEALRLQAQQRLGTIEKATAAIGAKHAIRVLDQRAELLEVVPGPWAEALSEQTAITALVGELTELQDRSHLATAEAERAASPIGIPTSLLAERVIDDLQIQTVAVSVEKFKHAEHSAIATTQSLGVHQELLKAAEAESHRALSRLVGVEPSTVASADLGVAARAAIERGRNEAVRLAAEATVKRSQLTAASAALSAAATQSTSAQTHWDALELGTSAPAWISRSPADDHNDEPAGAGGGHRLVQGWVLIALSVTLAAIGLWRDQSLAATLALAIGAAVWALTRRSQSRAPDDQRTTSTGVAYPGPQFDGSNGGLRTVASSDVISNAAVSVIQTLSLQSEAEAQRSSAEKLAAGAFEETLLADSSFRIAAASFGVQLSGPIEQVEAEITRWIDASEALARVSDLRDQLSKLDSQRVQQATEVDGVVENLRKVVHAHGLELPADPTHSDALFRSYREAVELAQEALTSRVRAEEAARTLGDLLGAAAVETEHWSADRLFEEINRLSELQGHHDLLDKQLQGATLRLRMAIDDDAEVEALVATDPNDEQLKTLGNDCEALLSELGEQLAAIHMEIGKLEAERDRIESEEAIARITAELGGEKDRQRELAVSAGTAAVAQAILSRVSDEYRRQNQPAVIARTIELAKQVKPSWAGLRADSRGNSGEISLTVEGSEIGETAEVKLSLGAKGLLHLALRLAMAQHDQASRGIALPLVCDDPLVHFDDQRAPAATRLLAEASRDRQVILFTCHGRTVDAAVDQGATLLSLD